MPPIADVSRMILGGSISCVIHGDRTASCWGSDGQGQLGNDSAMVDQPSPVRVAGLTDIVDLSPGYGTTCAVHGAGAVSCWGAGLTGGGAVPLPALVSGISDAVEVDTGADEACARRRGGAVVCWGSNSLGQLGNGSATPSASAVPVPGLADIVDITVGADHACALAAGGTVRCWGRGELGQIGDGGFANRSTPTAVPGITDAIRFVPEGGAAPNTCVVRRTGAIACWGYNEYGQLGDGSTTNAGTPVTFEM